MCVSANTIEFKLQKQNPTVNILSCPNCLYFEINHTEAIWKTVKTITKHIKYHSEVQLSYNF